MQTRPCRLKTVIILTSPSPSSDHHALMRRKQNRRILDDKRLARHVSCLAVPTPFPTLVTVAAHKSHKVVNLVINPPRLGTSSQGKLYSHTVHHPCALKELMALLTSSPATFSHWALPSPSNAPESPILSYNIREISRLIFVYSSFVMVCSL